MDERIKKLCDAIRETSFAIHSYHRNGHLEKIYENALLHRLRKQGFKVRYKLPLQVFDVDGPVLGDLEADLLVEKTLIIEVKAVKAIVDEHVAQLLGYLRSSRLEHGLLINFGAPRLQIRKYVMSAGHYDHRSAG
ncbi:MAG: GxxExxY protein [Planctomycetaceae bacterium]